jgi:PAS domain S-box-containing protein
LAINDSGFDLSRLAEFNQAIINSMREGLVVADNDGVFQLVNPAAGRMLGYDPEELVGRNQNCVVPQDQISVVAAAHKRRENGESDSYELGLVAKDGTRLPVRVAGSPLLLGGELFGTIAVFTDLTAHKRGEAQRERLQSQLRQAQKMEAVGQLAGGMAHDFNNILQMIVGFADLARIEASAGQSPLGSLDEVLKASERASRLVKQVLSFSRRSDETLKPMLFCPVVNDSLDLLRSTLPSTVEIRREICADFAPIAGNATLIHQILLNLGNNAVHAMEDAHGVFAVSVAPYVVDADPARRHDGLPPGNYVRLTARDDGRGMDTATRERVFEPYFTTKPRGDGTGLGMAVVHGIVSQMGGAITVDSEPGAGTTFEIYLPTLPYAPDVIEDPAQSEHPGGDERILFIDDEPQIVTMTRLQLSQFGYDVTAVADSAEALKKIAEAPDAYDLLITDQTMPGLTGSELAEQARRIRPDLPVILCTGYSNTIDGERAAALGIGALLAKPIARAELARTVRKVLDRTSD